MRELAFNIASGSSLELKVNYDFLVIMSIMGREMSIF